MTKRFLVVVMVMMVVVVYSKRITVERELCNKVIRQAYATNKSDKKILTITLLSHLFRDYGLHAV